MGKLSGKAALVTGGGRGIGPVICERLAEDGATIIVNYANSRTGAEEVVKKITGKGGKAVAVQADIRHRAEIIRMFQEIDRNPGRIDIVINCAGLGNMTPVLGEFTEEAVETVLGVNLTGPLYIANEAAKRMPSGGRVVNFGSSVARFPFPGSSVYAGAKSAIETFTEVWAKELGTKGITVNTVIPGATSPGHDRRRTRA
jgi:3-oxoacyl-[acyl-carrier protein] reductase